MMPVHPARAERAERAAREETGTLEGGFLADPAPLCAGQPGLLPGRWPDAEGRLKPKKRVVVCDGSRADTLLALPLQPSKMRNALTIGDPNGIGPEVAVNAAATPGAPRTVPVRDPAVIRHHAARHAPGMALATGPAAVLRALSLLAGG